MKEIWELAGEFVLSGYLYCLEYHDVGDAFSIQNYDETDIMMLSNDEVRSEIAFWLDKDTDLDVDPALVDKILDELKRRCV